MSIKLFVAEEHELVRAGIRRFVADSDIKVIAEACCGEGVLNSLKEHEVDVVTLGAVMPDMCGLTVLGRIKLDHPDLPVLMFSNHDNPNLIARSVALGAAGYLLKNCPSQRLIAAIHAAARHETIWTRDELRRVTGALATPRWSMKGNVPLTQREAEVLIGLSKGLTNREIGHSLNISYETVKEHVQHIFRKIGVTDRTQAAVWAVRNKIDE
ncbi:MAG: DNA-binding response regulator [Planctomycetota bacterium]|nr:MAG: DNA-binding response regulator [Planctomycetota bacterium]